ncbi:MAG: sulfate permease [Planctomycetes bacterium]|nr:sulfate permease [Planctomycetota bacterium]
MSGNGPIRKLLPFTDWLFRYRRADLPGDLLAGVIVTIMLIPQSLAYAMLAGLPPEYGLYASIAPLFIYGLLGTSRTLSVGPVAVVSLLTASALTPLAAPGSEQYVQLAILLALMTGVVQLVVGLVRGGFIASLLSHPVVAGFITGSSLLIILSQLKHMLGVTATSGHLPYEAAVNLAQALGGTNIATLLIGIGAVAVLLFFRMPFRKLLEKLGLSKALAQTLARTGPAVLVLAGMALVWLAHADTAWGVAVVGEFPSGLPGFSLPSLDLPILNALLPAALIIVLVGYVESVSVGRSLGARRRQVIDPDQELVALGAANIAAGFTSGMPVTGGFSRSVVNFDAGAQTGLASMITAVLIALVTLFLAPMFASLPQVVLAATVIVAVSGLVNFGEVARLWRYSRLDGALMALTIAAVLGIGVELGVAVGVGASLLLYLWRSSRPHIAIVGRVGESESFRNVLRHKVTTYPGLLLVRVDENLFFANTRFLEDRLLAMVLREPDLKHLVLICSSVSEIDSSALESVEALIRRLRDAGVTLHCAEIKGPVMDRLQKVEFEKHLAPGRVFLSTHDAVVALHKEPRTVETAAA